MSSSATKRWRLAKSLEKLREQVNAAHPSRDKRSDGSIGDAAHSARTSDHNPDGQGRVCAIDVTVDLANGVDGRELSRELAKDARTKYVIFAGEIFRSYKPNLGWAKYTGSNRHDKHVHISVLATKADDESAWANIGEPKPEQPVAPGFRSILRQGSKGQEVRSLQEKLNIPIDGQFGPATEKALKAFQKRQGLVEDGIVGFRVWAALELK